MRLIPQKSMVNQCKNSSCRNKIHYPWWYRTHLTWRRFNDMWWQRTIMYCWGIWRKEFRCRINSIQFSSESAYFNPVSVRKLLKDTSWILMLFSIWKRNWSHYYCLCTETCCITLIQRNGGEITPEIVDIYNKKVEDFSVF
jgi:hypothetical protein